MRDRVVSAPGPGPGRGSGGGGGWGEPPPYHVPVFVLTNHAREPITMKGGTVFHFVTGGIEEALRRAREAAGGGGGGYPGGGRGVPGAPVSPVAPHPPNARPLLAHPSRRRGASLLLTRPHLLGPLRHQ